MPVSLSGKVAIVTGASSGIGRATALAFAKEGMRLVLSGRSQHRLDAVAAGAGVDVLVVPADLTVAAEVDGLVEKAIAHFGQVDVLFANAGV